MVDKPFTIQIFCQLSHLYWKNYCVVFCWLPGHVGLPKNSATNEAVKEAAIDRTPLCDWTLATDICVFLYPSIYSSWQGGWTDTQSKLWDVKPTVQAWQSSSFTPIWRDEVIMTHLHIGHSCLMQAYLLQNEEAPMCAQCNVPLNRATHFSQMSLLWQPLSYFSNWGLCAGHTPGLQLQCE